VVSGDVADDGSPEAYAAAAGLVGGFARSHGARQVYCTGNHDDRAGFAEVLRDSASAQLSRPDVVLRQPQDGMTAPLLDSGLLSALDERWRARGVPTSADLHPGLSDAEMDALTAPLGLSLPGEARVWWRWANGVPQEAVRSTRQIGGGMPFLPLEEAVAIYLRHRGIAEELAARPDLAALGRDVEGWWGREWVPITVTGSGGVIVCDCGVERGAPTPIRFVDWEAREAYAVPVVPSFGQMVSWWIEAYDDGVWDYDADEARWIYRDELLSRERDLSRLV